jgi:hypothetical protein
MRNDESICEKLYALSVIVGVVLVMFVVGVSRCSDGDHPSVAKSDTVYVEKVVEKHDTIPVERVVAVVGKAKIPAVKGENLEDSCKNECEKADSITFDLVQKEYSDDSTYTAYVSGLRYGAYPKLDSVIVRQRIIECTITNTIYREKKELKVKLRPSVGGGYDPFNTGWGVYVGGAIVLDW